MARQLKRTYRDVFFAANGFGPYVCEFCSTPVAFEEVLVHHRDHDGHNHSVENLSPAHDSCHKSHHQRGRQWTDEHRANHRAAMIENNRKGMSEEVKQKISASLMGQPGRKPSEETRAKLSRAAKRRFEGNPVGRERFGAAVKAGIARRAAAGLPRYSGSRP